MRDALPRAVSDGSNLEARIQMMLATIYAGMGFSNSGVHIPHAMGYPIAGNVSGHDSLVNIRFGRAQHFASDGENGKGMKQRYTLLTKPLNASSF